MYSYGPPHMAGQMQDDQLEHTSSSHVRIRDVALKTCQRRWTIGRSGERGSGISVLAARHDDDMYAKMRSTLFENIKKKKKKKKKKEKCLQIIIYKQDLALNNQPGLTCHKTQVTNDNICSYTLVSPSR